MTLVEWRSARAVLLFVPLADEPAVFPLVAAALSAGKRVALPAFERETGTYQARVITNPETDLITGRFGVPEPRPGCLVVPVATLDFTVVPGVAFTPAGERLGRGLGFYDRMLANFRAVSCGVGFEEQIVAELPVEPHDVQLTYVATPAQVWACQSGSF
jgi:5-formyltetrahydrofolate cyclo-ligase